jgi:hypothetical protein
MPPRKLTRDGEQVACDLLEKMAELVDGGLGPDAALEKVARDAGTGPEMVRFVGRAFNTGQTVHRVQHGATPAEKAAAAPLCDPDAVVDRLYPAGRTKSASDAALGSAVAADYAVPPARLLADRALAEKAAALAAVDLRAGAPTPPADSDEAARARRVKLAFAERDRTARELAEKAAAVRRANEAAVVAVQKVAHYFGRPNCRPLREVAENCALVKGAQAAPLFQYAEYRVGPYLRGKFEKMAADGHDVDWAAEPYSLVDAALGAVRDRAKLAAEFAAAEKAARDRLGELFEPFMASDRPGSIADDPVSAREKAANFGMVPAVALGGTLGEIGKQMVRPEATSDLVNSTLSKLEDPAHEEELSAIRTQAMLHSLMADDPVLSGYPPEQVVEGYNRISEVAPQVARQRLPAQMMLRKYLEQGGAIDPFEIEQYGKIDRLVSDRAKPGV